MPSEPPEVPLELVELKLDNPAQAARDVLVNTGVPLPLELGLTSVDGLTLLDQAGASVPIQVSPRMRWGGVPLEHRTAPLRWIGLVFQAHLPASSHQTYTVGYGGVRAVPADEVRVDASPARICVDTGPARFCVPRSGPELFASASIHGHQVIGRGNGFYATDLQGRRFRATWSQDAIELEAPGPLEAVLSLHGWFVRALPGQGTGGPESGAASTGATVDAPLEFDMRLRFEAGQARVIIEHTLRNSRAAVHPGNVWTLGDPGSFLLLSARLELPVPGKLHHFTASLEGDAPISGTGPLVVLQASSGTARWRSARHVDRTGRVNQPFRGYRVQHAGEVVRRGLHAQPALTLISEAGGVTASLEAFWQNFPKGLETDGQRVLVYLFPPSGPQGTELQGGEQKTHRIHVWLEAPGTEPAPERRLNEMARVYPVFPPGWWLQSRASFQPDVPRGPLVPGSLEATLETAVHPQGRDGRSLMSIARARDAFGWRELGDVQADHETECGEPAGPEFVSHYNNQYDYVRGGFHQFGRTGDPDWLRFALPAAMHTADIDVYHTRADVAAYNGGMFWHTTHDTPAATSSHRSFPSLEVSRRCTPYQSGGPGLGHLYVEGLVTGALLAGDASLGQAALELGAFALNRRALGDETDGRSLGNYLRSMVTLCEWTGESRFCDGADRMLPFLRRRARHRGLDWQETFLGEALGRWLELDEARGAAGVPLASGEARAAALEALVEICERIVRAELPPGVYQARFADVLAYGCRYRGKHPSAARWRRTAVRLLENLERGYWARGTYPNAKELSLMLGSGGAARVLRAGPGASPHFHRGASPRD